MNQIDREKQALVYLNNLHSISDAAQNLLGINVEGIDTNERDKAWNVIYVTMDLLCSVTRERTEDDDASHDHIEQFQDKWDMNVVSEMAGRNIAVITENLLTDDTVSGDDMRLRGKYLTLYANTLVNFAVRMGKSDVVRESLEAMAREMSITAKVMESIKSYNKM